MCSKGENRCFLTYVQCFVLTHLLFCNKTGLSQRQKLPAYTFQQKVTEKTETFHLVNLRIARHSLL